MKKIWSSGFPVLAVFACLVLAFAGTGFAETTAHDAKTAVGATDTPDAAAVSPGTPAFQGLIPPAGSGVIAPITTAAPPADKTATPAVTTPVTTTTTTTTTTPAVPIATVRYGVTKPDGEDTHPTLNLSPDKAELVRLDADAGTVIVGSPDNLNVQLENRRLLVLSPQIPGATYLSILDDNGNVIMQRHVIVASPKSNYVRIRRSCAGQASGCETTSVYYCPGMCHAVGASAPMPSGSTAEVSGASNSAAGSSAVTPPTTAAPTPTISTNPVSVLQ